VQSGPYLRDLRVSSASQASQAAPFGARDVIKPGRADQGVEIPTLIILVRLHLGVARVLGALVSRVDPGALVVRKGVVYLGDRGSLRNLIVDDRVEEHKQSVDRLGLIL